MISTVSYPWMTQTYTEDEIKAEVETDINIHRITTQPFDPETEKRTIDMRLVRPEID